MAGGLTPIGRTGRGGRRSYRPLAEINVTPFVDVMLVLLIVFMVTAPLLTVGVAVDLPRAAAPTLPGQDEPLVVTVSGDGQIYVQEEPIEFVNLVPLLAGISEENPEARIFVRGDRALPYGRIMEVMGELSRAGFRNVSLVAEMPSDATP
ncbi:MAG: protein TolR [Alphaproteobacteria bacterium]|jgi:biopolymer transport protein TolR|nr:protein TolR [Alphaproteobacteria bacterium]